VKQDAAVKKQRKRKVGRPKKRTPVAKRQFPPQTVTASAASRRAGICGRDTSSASGANAWPSSSMAMAHRNQVIVGRRRRIVETADHALEVAQAFVHVGGSQIKRCASSPWNPSGILARNKKGIFESLRLNERAPFAASLIPPQLLASLPARPGS
jgi:hypothetical protein